MDYNYVKHLYEYWERLEEHLEYCFFPRILYFWKIILMKMKINGNWDINTQKLLLTRLKRGKHRSSCLHVGTGQSSHYQPLQDWTWDQFLWSPSPPKGSPCCQLLRPISMPFDSTRFLVFVPCPSFRLTRWCDLTAATCPEVAWLPGCLFICLHAFACPPHTGFFQVPSGEPVALTPTKLSLCM